MKTSFISSSIQPDLKTTFFMQLLMCNGQYSSEFSPFSTANNLSVLQDLVYDKVASKIGMKWIDWSRNVTGTVKCLYDTMHK